MLTEIRDLAFRPPSRRRRHGDANSPGTRRRAARRLLLERLEDRRLLATVQWISDADGFWDDASNWADEQGAQRVPEAGDDVIIDRPDADVRVTFRSGTVAVDSLTSVESILVTGGTLTVASAADLGGQVTISGGHLRFNGEPGNSTIGDVQLVDGSLGGSGGVAIQGPFRWTGGNLGQANAGGLIDLMGETIVDGTAVKYFAGGTITNHGHFRLDGEENIVVSSTGTFNNLADAIFEIRVDQGIRWTNGNLTFHNHGVLTKTGGTGTSEMFNFGSTLNHAGGIIRIETGELSLRPVGDGSGSWEVNEDATLRVISGNYQGAGASLSAQGDVRIQSGTFGLSGEVNITGRTFLSGSFPSPGMGRLRLNGQAETTHLGEVFLAGGWLGGTGGGTINGPLHWTRGGLGESTGELDLLGETFVDGSAVKYFAGGTLNNQGHFRLDGEENIVVSGTGTFNNLADAIFEIRVDQGIRWTNGNLTFHNHGVLTKTGGTGTSEMFNFGSTHNHAGGIIRIETGELSLRPVGDGGGSWEVNEGATLRVISGNYQGAGASLSAQGDVRIQSGTFALSGDLKLLGQTHLNGTFTASGTVELAGTVRLSPNSRMNLDGDLLNLVDGTLSDVEIRITDGQLRLPENVRILDSHVRLTGANARVHNAANQNALMELEAISPVGSLTLAGGRDLSVGSLTNSGILDARANSTLTVSGDYVQTESGVLRVSVGGDPESDLFSRYHVTGSAQLDGRLEIELVGEFGPLKGQLFEFLRFAEQSGDFAQVDGLQLGSVPVFERLLHPDSMVLAALIDATDLAPVSIIVPEEGVPGEMVSITYTVENLAEPPALGEWVDSLYLSTDLTLDPSDRLIARVTHEGPVEGATSYTRTLEAALPAAVEGNYRVILLADSRGLVPDSNRNNNLLVSQGVIQARVPVLPLGETVVHPIEHDESIYYRVDVPAGMDVRVTAELQQLLQADVYARYGHLPTPSQFELRGNPSSPLQQDLLLAGQSGPWYLLLHGREGSESGQTVSLSAEAIDFELTRFSPTTASHAAPVNLTLSGSGFSPLTTAALIGADGSSLPASQLLFHNRNTLIARFDLGGLEPGAYQLRVDEGDHFTIAPQALTVTTGDQPGRPDYQIQSPPRIRPFTQGSVTVDTWNVGDTQSSPSLLWIRGGEASYRIDSDDRQWLMDGGGTRSLAFVGLDPSGNIDLDSGMRASSEFPFQSTTGALSPPDPLVFSLQRLDHDHVFSWELIKEDVRPERVSAEAWDVIFTNFVAHVGDTLAEFEESVIALNRYLGQVGQATQDLDLLVGFCFQLANHAVPGTPLSAITDAAVPATGLPLFLSRAYLPSISSRFDTGPFGRGWSTPYDVQLLPENEQGIVTVVGPGYAREFRRVERRFSSFGFESVEVSWHGTGGDLGVIHSTPDHQPALLLEPDGSLLLFDGPDGRISSITDADGHRVTLHFTDELLTRIAHSDGLALDLEYNQHGRVDRLIDHAGAVTTYTYDPTGETLLTAAGPQGTSRYRYHTDSGAARQHALASVIAPDGTHTEFEYDDFGRLIRAGFGDEGDPEEVRYAYDLGALHIITDEGTSTLYHNAFGQVARLVDPTGQVFDRHFDDQQRIVREVTPGNFAVNIRYDSFGLPSRIIDPLGNRVKLSYGQGGVSFADQAGVKFSSGWRLTGFEDPLGRSTAFQRDDRGHLIGIVYPDGAIESFSYDASGLPLTYQNRRQQVHKFSTNELGQLVQREGPDGVTEEFSYDDYGRLLTATNRQGTTRFEYDDAGRLTLAEYPNGRFLRYEYNENGQLTRLEDQDGSATVYAYDNLGRLQQVTDANGSPIVAYAYDALGRLVLETRGNGATTAYEYDSISRLLSLIHVGPDSETLEHFSFQYDTAGRRTGMSTLDGQWTYTYDAIGQLTAAVFESANPDIPDQDLEYDYDAIGNRIRAIENGQTILYAGNDRNQYTLVGDKTYTYDADGNLLSISDGGGETVFSYDADSRLVGIVSPEGTWSFEYDVLGNRVATIHDGERTEYLVDPTGMGDVLAEYDADGNPRARYAHGLGLAARFDQGGNASYFHFDAIGSTIGLTDSDGGLLNRYRYLPYGGPHSEAQEAVENPFQFVGQFGVMREVHGLDFMRARFHSPVDGRFINEDPIRHAGGLNLYQYANNDPITTVDPEGLAPYSTQIVLAMIRGRGPAGYIYASRALLAAAHAELAAGHGSVAIGRAIAQVQAQLGARAIVPQASLRHLAAYNVARGLPGGFVSAPAMGVMNLASAFVGGYMLGRYLDSQFDLWTPVESFWGNAVYDSLNYTEVGSASTAQLTSWDPNDIIGPPGFGPEGFLTGDFPLPYMIRFENLDEATAPAAEVVITQQLDPDLDWTTFELGSFGFDQWIMDVPPGRHQYSTRIDLIDSIGLLVEFEAGINRLTGLATWRFTTLDPETLDIPMDPLRGFLPPNVTSPEGEGFVTYRILAREGLPTGTRIDAEASIVFDTNEPIETPPILNTIDAGPPTSRVDPLVPVTFGEQLILSWDGEDDPGGSGIRQYDLFVAADGGPFQIWLAGVTDRSATFVGEIGSAYAFYSLAVDQVGRTEADKSIPDAETSLIPIPWSNPSNRYDVNGDGEVTARDALIVINAIGRHGGPGPVSEFPWAGFYLDVSQDGIVSALDALLVINQLARGVPGGGSESGEGEAQGVAAEGGSGSQDRVVESPGMSSVKADWASESRSGTVADRPIGPAGFGPTAPRPAGWGDPWRDDPWRDDAWWDDAWWDDERRQPLPAFVRDRPVTNRPVTDRSSPGAGDGTARAIAISELFGRDRAAVPDSDEGPRAGGTAYAGLRLFFALAD